MSYTSNTFLFSILLLLASCNHICAHGGEDQQEQSFFVRIWGSLFGSSQSQNPECPNCQNAGGQNIDNAYITRGQNQSSGSSAYPAQITNLYGGQGLSDETLLALEKEKTRQLELANERALQEEHERNRWFNTLVQYVDERWSELDSKQQKELIEQAAGLLGQHHQVLRELEQEKGKIELEREHIRQENLPALLHHDLEKNKLLHQQLLEKLSYVGSGIYTFTGDKKHMVLTALMVSGVICGAYVSKRGTKIAANYVSSLIMQPSLVTETSRISINQFLRHPVATMMKEKTALPEALYNEGLQKRVASYINSIKASKQDGQPFPHGLFYGGPGTGKTLLAKKIAHELDMDYAIIPGANIHQFGKDAVTELNKLFNWAERKRPLSKKNGTVIFFDEIDALVPNRLNNTVSELTRQIQNTLYARTGVETDQFLVLGATNTPKFLDPAFLSRMDERIEFLVPDTQTRMKLIRLYIDKYVKNTPHVQVADEVEPTLRWTADQIKGFSGRNISQLTRSWRAAAINTENKKLTPDIIKRVVYERVEQHRKLSSSGAMEALT